MILNTIAKRIIQALGNATAGDVIAGKTFSSEEVEPGTTGTMTNNGATNYMPTTSNQSVAKGYHSGSGVVYGDADLVATNIKSGVNIFGVVGNYVGSIVLSSIQSGSATMGSSDATLNIDITTIDISKSFFVLSYNHNYSGDSPYYGFISAKLTSSQIQISRRAASGAMIFKWFVVSFSSGVSVQHKSDTKTNTTYVDTTITAVDRTKSFIIAHNRGSSSIYTTYDAYLINSSFTSDTNVRSESISAKEGIIEFQVVTFA